MIAVYVEVRVLNMILENVIVTEINWIVQEFVEEIRKKMNVMYVEVQVYLKVNVIVLGMNLIVLVYVVEDLRKMSVEYVTVLELQKIDVTV